MNPTDAEWIDRWLLQTIANSVGAELQERFDREKSYSPEQVAEACEARSVHGASRACALAMFAEPGALQNGGQLLPLGITDPAPEFRKKLVHRVIGSDDSGAVYDGAYDFHPGFTVHHLTHDSADGGSSHGDGGGCDGGSGGGD